MWGQGRVVDPDKEDSQSAVEGPQAVEADPGDVATALETEIDLENRLENEMHHVLGGLTDAFSVNVPFTKEDKKRIVDKLNTISEENEGEDLKFTHAVVVYMLKELRDVFGNQDAFEEEGSLAAAIEEGTEGQAHGGHEGRTRMIGRGSRGASGSGASGGSP